MSTAAYTEVAKFDYLLQLAHAQIEALESDDLFAFDRILVAKRQLIESLTDAHSLVNADPALATMVARIQDADKAAQRLLYRKVGKIMREMSEINLQKKARGAYTQSVPQITSHPIGFLSNTPRYMDVQS